MPGQANLDLLMIITLVYTYSLMIKNEEMIKLFPDLLNVIYPISGGFPI